MGGALKCLVWDLDRTLWAGVLVEGDPCPLRPGAAEALRELDARGILHSIASANDAAPSLAHLRRLGVADYFLGPRIGWDDKVDSLQGISVELGVPLEAIGFVDDEPFERAQVRERLPMVRVYDAREVADLPARPELTPAILTPESGRRRQMYLQEKAYASAEQEPGVSRLEFLRSCRTVLAPRRAVPDDTPRILELLQRTHQLNATGVVYGPDEVRAFMTSPGHQVFVATLADRFVDYGRIAVAVCRCEATRWTVLSCLLSCRVLRRGVGNVFLGWLETMASRAGAAELRAHFVPRERNRPMYLQYTMAGFEPDGSGPDGIQFLSRPCRAAPPVPAWIGIAEGGRA